ncbi:ATP-binding protein [Pleomorphomonas oryzae]|uniref:ATP-binding protein n=1 Tax=Pleomorphomonas oryzae TaxID=261934 RepID=UPI0003F94351|nr:ATP-binding protein [Pleomorphomonas oryzae]
MHKGGIADKVGNRFEARWLTHQLLGLLDGTILTITIEMLGDDEQGFEFSVVRTSGTEWHQCKRQTASGTWSIAALDAAGVLAAFRAKIGTGGARCLFVSSDPSPQLKLLQEKLPATHNIEAFEASLSDNESRYWSVLKERLGGDAADAFRFLGHSEFRTLSEPDLTDIVRARLAYWFKGDPDTIAAQFRTWLEEDHNFNRPIGYDDVIAFVRKAGIEAKQYELDRSLPGRIRDATSSYVGSYPPLGAGLFRIDREIVQDILGGLRAGAGVVLLVGAAGTGKSAIVADVIDRLREEGTLHLAFRVDQAGSVATLDELGLQTVGTADSPVVVLEKLAAQKKAVLIIDQADAVSEVSGRVAKLRRVVLDLVRKAAHYPHVQLIFACRSFDLENDHAFREIAKVEGNVRIDVGAFDRSEIDPVLTRLGILHDAQNSRLMALLGMPIGLTLAATLAQSGISDLRRVEHLSELYSRLLQAREQEIQRDFRPGWNVYEPLTAIAKAMSERQELVASVATLDLYAGALDILQRVGLIVARGHRVGFIHESLFDYLHARAFVREGKPIINFLLASEQTLFRRTQTRQILAFERELERARYLSDLGTILSDTRVRPHIRETIVRWLATIPDPTPAEWELIASYAKCDGLPRKTGYVIFERKPWFDLLQTLGMLNGWLACEGDDLTWALNFLRSIVPLAPDEIAKLIDDFLERRPERVREVLDMLRFIDPKVDAELLANGLITALSLSTPGDWQRDGDDWGAYYRSWVKSAPREAARIFGAQLGRWFDLNPEGHPFMRRYEDGGASMHSLSELARAAPLAFLEQLLPFMRLAMERTIAGDKRPAENSIWPWRPLNRTDVRSVDLLDIVRSALAEIGRYDPLAAMRLLRAMEPETHITSLHLLLETIPANPEALHDLLLEQLENPGLFEAGWHMADGHSAGRAIAVTMPWLNGAERDQVEATVLSIRTEIDYAKRNLLRRRDEVGAPDFPLKTSGYVMHWLNQSGRCEWSVLLQIGAEQLSPHAAKRLAELDRKFVGQRPEEPEGISGGWVRSPIAGERTKFMSDDAWLSAIKKFSGPRDEMRSRGNGLIGGAWELSRELKERAKEAPERFLSLFLRFPEGTHQDFARGITSGIAESKPNREMIERVLAAVNANPAARPDDQSLAWMIQACKEPLGPQAEALLLRIATGDDDSTGLGDTDHSKDANEPDWKRAFTLGSDLIGKAINSARGSALDTLGRISWKSKEAFEKYRAAIDAIVGKPAAAHIHSALSGLIMSALKHEGKQGVDWTLRTARSCPEAFYTNDGQQIIGWIADLDAESFAQLIKLYLTNDNPLARGFAALAIFRRSLDDQGWLPLAETLIDADAEYRSAAAAVAASNFKSARFGTACTGWLTRFFDDEDKTVRDEASDCFRQMEAPDIVVYAGLFEAYIASKYFEIDHTFFLHQLEQAPPGLDEVLLKLLEDTLQAITKNGRKANLYEMHQIGELLLKLYASNIAYPSRRTRALDMIDLLIERGLMEMQKLEAV